MASGGHSLGWVCFLFNNFRLLDHLGRAVMRREDLGWAGLTYICHLEGGINPRASKAKCLDDRRIVYTLYSL